MIQINSSKGVFQYDEDTGRIYVNGVLGSSKKYEPIFVGGVEKGDYPQLCGILLKEINSVVTINGGVHKITDDLNNVI